VKFDEKYPDKVSAVQVYPGNLMGPHKEVWVTETLCQSWRMYPCVVCGKRTGWRDASEGVTSPMCSEECLAQAQGRKDESDGEEAEGGEQGQ
jgi:hypothetical protein